MSRAIFINLPAQDVAAARTFYEKMGFSINESYSNDQAVFVVVDEGINLILISHDLFKENALRDIADPASAREVSIAIQLDDREAVDKMIEAGIAAGGKEEGEVMDDEILYSRGICDLNGHRLDINCLKSSS